MEITYNHLAVTLNLLGLCLKIGPADYELKLLEVYIIYTS